MSTSETVFQVSDESYDDEITKINCKYCDYCQQFLTKDIDKHCIKVHDMCKQCYSKHRSGNYLHNCDFCDKWYTKNWELICKCKQTMCSLCYYSETLNSRENYRAGNCNICSKIFLSCCKVKKCNYCNIYICKHCPHPPHNV